jgi:hypothetical protein
MAINVTDLKKKSGNLTLSEAKKLISEIVPYWESQKEGSKIQTLGNWIIKWLKENAEKDSMKTYYSEIVAIKRRIANANKLNKPTTLLEEELTENQESLSTLEAKYGKYIPPKSTSKKKTE